MTPVEYCYEKIAAGKSSIYFSLKKIPAEKRDVIVVVAAFYQELEDVLLKSSEPMVAQQQLHWWRTEVIKIPQGLASHPVCIALQQYPQINPQTLFDIIDGMEQTIAFQSFATFEDLVVHIMRTAGARELLMGKLLGLPIPEETIYQFSLVMELVNYIQHTHSYMRRGLLMFPADELNKFNVLSDAFYAFKTTPEIQNLLAAQVEKVERAYQQANQALTSNMRASAKHLLARCEIALATLREIQGSGFTVLENLIQLTPLKMWWVAYRVK